MEILAFLTQLLLLGLSIFLMIVILLQRGRGGGLAGAFGGLGGQSAFGTKAGDVFTKITIVIAVCWVVVAGGSGYFLRAVEDGSRAKDLGEVASGVSSAEGVDEGLDEDFDFSAGDLGLPGGEASDSTPAGDSGADSAVAGDTDDAPPAEGADSPPSAEDDEAPAAGPDTASETAAEETQPADDSTDAAPQSPQP